MLPDRGYSILLQTVLSFFLQICLLICGVLLLSSVNEHHSYLRTATGDDQVLIMGEGTPSAKWRSKAYLKQVHSSGVTLSLSGDYVVKEMLNRSQSLRSRFGYAISYKSQINHQPPCASSLLKVKEMSYMTA